MEELKLVWGGIHLAVVCKADGRDKMGQTGVIQHLGQQMKEEVTGPKPAQ